MSTPVNVIIESLLDGFWLNLEVLVVTLLGSLPLGLIIMFGSMSRLGFRVGKCKVMPVRVITRAFVWIIRGTPLMLQLMVVFYGPGLLWGTPIKSRMTATLLAFIVNYAAYFSEIYRGGLESISRGQYEAGQVLGMTRPQVFFRVVLLQVVKRITPAMGNEFMTLVKDTSLARVIGVMEIIMCAERYRNMGQIWPLFSTALFFLAFNGALTLLFGRFERKLDYFKA